MSHLRLGLRLGGLWLDDPPGLSSLFAAGQPGYWPGGYDPAAGRLWQDSAGATPAVAPAQPVGRVARVAGTADAAQPTALSRPTLARWPKGGRRNLLLRSDDFANGLWAISQMAVASGAVASPVPGRMADKIVATAVNGGKFVHQSVAAGAANVFSFYAKAAEYHLLRVMEIGSYAWRATFDLSSGVISQSGGASFVAAGMAAVGGGWWRCWLSSSRAVSSAFSVGGFPDDIPPPTNTPASYTGDGVSGLYVWGAQVEIGPAPSAYQRVTTASDVTEAGVPDAWHLFTDGGDSLPVTLPAGLYDRAAIDHLGNVAVDTVTLATAGPVETLVHQRQADVVIRQGAFTSPEIARIESYARRVAG